MKSIALAVARQKLLCAVVTIVGAAAGSFYAFTLPKIYVATTIVMPPRQGSGVSLMSQLGSLANISGVSGAINAPDEVYLAIVKSRSMQDHLVQRFDLIKRYQSKGPWEARERVTANTKAFSDKKSGLVTISVEDIDPVFASRMANGYVEQLRAKVASLALTEAQSKRMYVERQIVAIKLAIAKSEEEFRRMKSLHGFNLTELQAESAIRSSLELRKSIAEKEIQLNVASSYATSRNPEVTRLASELGALKGQLAKLEGASQMPAAMSEQGTGAVTAFREMKVLSATLDALFKQLEIAKMDEAREGPAIQIIDEAKPPEKPSKPSRRMIVMVSAALSFLAGCLLSLWVDTRQSRVRS